jgi:hypothetical protein
VATGSEIVASHNVGTFSVSPTLRTATVNEKPPARSSGAGDLRSSRESERGGQVLSEGKLACRLFRLIGRGLDALEVLRAAERTGRHIACRRVICSAPIACEPPRAERTQMRGVGPCDRPGRNAARLSYLSMDLTEAMCGRGYAGRGPSLAAVPLAPEFGRSRVLAFRQRQPTNAKTDNPTAPACVRRRTRAFVSVRLRSG